MDIVPGDAWLMENQLVVECFMNGVYYYFTTSRYYVKQILLPMHLHTEVWDIHDTIHVCVAIWQISQVNDYYGFEKLITNKSSMNSIRSKLYVYRLCIYCHTIQLFSPFYKMLDIMFVVCRAVAWKDIWILGF